MDVNGTSIVSFFQEIFFLDFLSSCNQKYRINNFRIFRESRAVKKKKEKITNLKYNMKNIFARNQIKTTNKKQKGKRNERKNKK